MSEEWKAQYDGRQTLVSVGRCSGKPRGNPWSQIMPLRFAGLPSSWPLPWAGFLTLAPGNKPLPYSYLENPMNSMKRQKDRTLKDELFRSVGAQYATGDEWRTNSRKNKEMEPKQKQHPVVDVTGDESKVLCYKEQYCIGTWNVRSWIKANWK